MDKLSQKRFLFDILDRKECFLYEKSKVLKKSKKSRFSKGVTPLFLSTIPIFSHGYFFDKLSKKSLFFDVLSRKESFLDLKSEVLKKFKQSKFFKVVSPWFLSKNRIFSHWYVLGKLSQRRFFLDIVHIEKNAFYIRKVKF